MSKAPINWTNMLLFSLTPLFAVTLVPLYGYFYGYDLFEWVVFALFMAFCGFSITAGYHRLWSHKAYKAHPAVKILFALGGACALQNDVLTWASDHRRHHLHVDDNDRDPYSAGRGFWFSHIGWILRRYQSGLKDLSNVKDLQKDGDISEDDDRRAEHAIQLITDEHIKLVDEIVAVKEQELMEF